MNWKDIVKNRPIEDIPDEMYDDSHSYENPKEIESLMRRKQKVGGLMYHMKKELKGQMNTKDGFKLWDKIVTDLKKEYDTNKLSNKNYRNGTIVAGSHGVDKSVMGMITNLDDWKGFFNKHGISM
mgnify:CR=1 FL=1|tara:strand:+ start:313 stop:687 length:375 start_codon:yes stop_codon:yes gene_type:complete